MFNNDGLNLCLMNGYYDELYPEKKETKGEIYPEYDDMVGIANDVNSRKVFIKLQEHIRNKNYQYVKYDNFRCKTAVMCIWWLYIGDYIYIDITNHYFDCF